MNNGLEEEFHDTIFAEHDIEDWLGLDLISTLTPGCSETVLSYVGEDITIILFNDCTLKTYQDKQIVTYKNASFCMVGEIIDNIKENN